MESENETVDDIVKEKRDTADEAELKGKNTFLFDLAKMLREEANRIEAASKRECEATREKSSQVGNAAKMSEACANIAEYAKAATCHTENSIFLGYLYQIEEWAESALAAPPRNCDRFTTLDDARNAFFEDYVPDETCSSANAFAIWLFDEAKGESEVEK